MGVEGERKNIKNVSIKACRMNPGAYLDYVFIKVIQKPLQNKSFHLAHLQHIRIYCGKSVHLNAVIACLCLLVTEA